MVAGIRLWPSRLGCVLGIGLLLSIALPLLPAAAVAQGNAQCATVEECYAKLADAIGSLTVQQQRQLGAQLGTFLEMLPDHPIQVPGAGLVGGGGQGSIADILKLITGASYVAGLGFAIGAILKFQAHKDNPQPVPISMPIVFLFIAAALIFAPSVFQSIGGTLYGSADLVAGVDGIVDFG